MDLLGASKVVTGPAPQHASYISADVDFVAYISHFLAVAWWMECSMASHYLSVMHAEVMKRLLGNTMRFGSTLTVPAKHMLKYLLGAGCRPLPPA